MNGKMKTGVFISYGHDEYAVLARRIKEDLEQNGFHVWMDEEGIRHTHDWECSIRLPDLDASTHGGIARALADN